MRRDPSSGCRREAMIDDARGHAGFAGSLPCLLWASSQLDPGHREQYTRPKAFTSP